MRKNELSVNNSALADARKAANYGLALIPIMAVNYVVYVLLVDLDARPLGVIRIVAYVEYLFVLAAIAFIAWRKQQVIVGKLPDPNDSISNSRERLTRIRFALGAFLGVILIAVALTSSFVFPKALTGVGFILAISSEIGFIVEMTEYTSKYNRDVPP